MVLVINKSNCRWAVVWFCYHSYDYRPNWTPLNLITITYEKYQINYCWNRVLTTLKVLVSLSSARTPLRLISVYQEIISSFRSHRAIFPRFNNVPAKKPEILCCWKTYCLNGKWTYRQPRKSWKFSREFTQNNQQRRNAPIQWSLSISESNLLIKGYGKHQQSLVKKILQSHAILLIGKNTISFVSWFLSSEEFWPNIRNDPAGIKFKHQIPERPDSRKYLEIRFNFLQSQEPIRSSRRSSMKLRVLELLRET